MIYILCVLSFLFGFFMCSLFTVGKRADENSPSKNYIKALDDSQKCLNCGFNYGLYEKTNFGRIKRMTVDEMVDFLTSLSFLQVISKDNACNSYEFCKEWLLKEEQNNGEC